MPRGRSKDTTLPLTRQLTAQRDYRARKAAKLVRSALLSPTNDQQGLQEQVDRLSAENAALVAEVKNLRAKLGDPERLTAAQEAAVTAARNEMMQAVRRLESVLPPTVNGSAIGPASTLVNGSTTLTLPTTTSPIKRMDESSPSSSMSSTAASPPPQVEVFDPNCCDGVFDCSSLPGIPISDVRSQEAAAAGTQPQRKSCAKQLSKDSIAVDD